MNSRNFLSAIEVMLYLSANMNPSALSLRLQMDVQSKIKCSGVSDSMLQNRQFALEIMPILDSAHYRDGICHWGG